MALKFFVLVCLAVLVVADEVPVYELPPPPPPSYGPKEPDYPDVPPNYTYKYGVADGYSGNNYEHSEVRDGYKTEGSYVVDLPDGRKQIVNYFDNGDGLVAQVTFEGEAQYPPSYPDPPAPVYS
ncbi:pro-resilin-like [Palaemon carinicauda]|uniref:pro-resilin-like n=1 Tax=Palaemon carinicauda TaxID=392227 RepID=UPI0035B602C9